MRRAAPLLLLLAACAQAPAPPPVAPSFREAGAPIGSSLRASTADLAGDWVVSAAYPGALPVAPGTRLRVEEAPGGAVWTFGGTVLPTTLAGTGRYRAEGAELWVLWVDDDIRTAAIGTPGGAFGWIMDRPGQASPDRAAAAREMLDFNGYDLARLR